MNKIRKLGQHFLISSRIANKIVNFAQVDDRDVVIEIGAGKGALSSQLLKKGAIVIAVEIDKKYYDYLKDKFINNEKFYAVNEDILRLEINEVLREFNIGRELVKIIGNIPFSITSPLIDWLIKERNSLIQATLMLQKEFAQRLVAGWGEKAYGKLSVVADLYFKKRYGFDVRRTMFRPIPMVDASIIQLIRREQLALPIEEDKIASFISFLNYCFAHPRKTLVKSLQLSLGGKKDTEKKQRIIDIITRENLRHCVRANELTLENFYNLYRYFIDLNNDER
jgi:16S rRNA (adenine1518-N6/adenine1519-N6)-dimethyltransferase